ncbi:UvrD-helicase domain-containing protein [Paenibacillus sp. MAH-36]|uniref:DNA 3'-5' helicase n=1 Tax=Paenibacillus violae TaxID=3077234 RepID=A0ABU3RND6_9BACL|nr:UvrD-helicase domain-containing protein [Paenibacillus sp. PFR10]MDU0205806.1 UvrD-helicase domain-containing protein [Paenibacillus sp. PFR10]
MNTPKHSVLLVALQGEVPGDVRCLLAEGIKVILFTDSTEGLEPLDSYKKANLLHVHLLTAVEVARFGMLHIVDGHFKSLGERRQLEKLANISPLNGKRFNVEQYLVEHAPPQMHLNVKAGAGTGKTTVMVQRILYILHVTGVPLKEMAMITFTREASHRMFQKLREAFYLRFEATGALKYLQYIEELPKMQISTIHSFARKLIKDLGAIEGFGSNVRIKSFKMERKQIIEDQINHWMEMQGDPQNVLSKFNGMMIYEVIDIANEYWEEMEKKGLNAEEITNLQWGRALESSEALHGLFSSIFPKCETSLQQLKYDLNAISLNDLTRQLNAITGQQGALFQNASRLRYLFIDEFQDTDDIQIKLAVRLVEAYGLKLFVVGDIKQSIYRFRGAKYTAFDLLRIYLLKMGERIKNYFLSTNYRSSVALLEEMHAHFEKWGEEELLPYGTKDHLHGVKPGTVRDHYWMANPSFERYSSEQAAYTVRKIREAQTSLDDSNTEKVALLVRTNKQALQLRQWCEKAGIPVQLNIGGTFYLSRAVQDFHALVKGLLFPDLPVALLNMLNSSYSPVHLDWTVLTPLDGDEGKLLEFLKQVEVDGKRVYAPWEVYLEELRIAPVLSVLRRIVEDRGPVQRYYHMELQHLDVQFPDQDNRAEAKARALQYQLNLNHLFELVHRQFSSEFVTLYALQQWLQVQMSVNRDEDEPELEEAAQANRVQIMTVHKSKGLEFHTVLIPFTEPVFRFPQKELLLEKESTNWRAGWFIRKGEDPYGSLTHNELERNEDEETQKEETRLLYVAMTRAESRLWIIANRAKTYNNWYMLLAKRRNFANA